MKIYVMNVADKKPGITAFLKGQSYRHTYYVMGLILTNSKQ